MRFLLDQKLILSLQRLSGNAAVGRLLESRTVASLPIVQRCGEHGCTGDCSHVKPTSVLEPQWLQRAVVAPIALTSAQFTGDARLEQAAANSPPIERGATGDAVKKIQRALMDEGFAMAITTTPGGPDGIFGAETEHSVKAFQHKQGLGVDGIVGHDTLAKLDELNLVRAAGPIAPSGPAPVTGFEVRGKLRQTAASNDPGKVFFVENKTDIDALELTKITALAKPDDRQLTLNGFCSEDEADGPALVHSRLEAVAKTLKDAGHVETKVTLVPKPDAGAGRIDYRNLRAVEIVVAGAHSQVPDCTLGADVDLGPPENPFTKGQTRALSMLDAAIGKLHDPLDPDTAALLTRLFGGHAHMAELRTNLQKIRDHVHHMADPGKNRAHNPCDGTCSGAIAYNNGVGAGAIMTLCPAYIGLADDGERAGTLIHEGSHGTAGLQTDDLAYEFERVINFLAPADALKNADSYLLFARNAETPGSERIGPEEADAFSGTANPAEEKAVERIMAYLERWLDSASSEMSSLYDTINESRNAGAWTNTYYEASMKLVAHRFGLTAPPTIPSKDDQEAVAGISDRYERLFRRLGRKITITKTAAGVEVWEPGPGTAVTLTPKFFRLTKRQQLDLLLTCLIQAFPEIIPAHQPTYVSLTNEIRTHFGTPAP